MSKARVVVTALVVEQLSVAEVAARYGVHRSWVYKLRDRFEAEGEAAFEPRSRRPISSPTATAPEIVELVLGLRKQLAEAGLDAGADTIGWHLTRHHGRSLSRATINRILARAGTVTPAPQKRPRSSYIRFHADQPNECWQADFTHYRLTRLDSSLTDNGMVFTTRLSGGSVHGTRGHNGLETELRRLNVKQKNSRPNHPTTCGKVERVQQTMKNWLRAQASQPATVHQLQILIDEFVTTEPPRLWWRV